MVCCSCNQGRRANMFALGNVEKFLAELDPPLPVNQREEILTRAAEFQRDGIIMGGLSQALWGDERLQELFAGALNDPDHIEMGMGVIQRAKT